MYKVFATNLADSGADLQSRHRTLEQAMRHLYELIQSEVQDPAGPMFDRYGLFREEGESAAAWFRQDLTIAIPKATFIS